MGEIAPMVGDILTLGTLSRRRVDRAARRAQEEQERALQEIRSQAANPRATKGGRRARQAKGGTILTEQGLGTGGSELPTRRPTLLGQ